MRFDKADLALIGGSPEERNTIAIRMRRAGLRVHSEFKNRKRDKMFKAAREEVRFEDDVLDLSDPEQRQRVDDMLSQLQV